VINRVVVKDKARTLKAWALEVKAKALNPRGKDEGHKCVIEAKACPRGLDH